MGRPGLLGTMARTAVIAGTANATTNAMNRRAATRQQASAPAYPQASPAAEPAAADGGESPAGLVDQIQRLAVLHEQGALSDAEFAEAKARLLG
ncbi:SHOCT domain-containing protein [Nocardioides panacisoli]|uniref:SHOCT domain-containing protein n=1 Tax=Nocardioides panacisoli TaxID=627624 RepID=UPI001C635A95|nr:SHOCT domain-containing protein [Nocardioides panacisoli]QYJ04838.1 SHOCT domain-containing protein [Nocardioides panacisoli]